MRSDPLRSRQVPSVQLVRVYGNVRTAFGICSRGNCRREKWAKPLLWLPQLPHYLTALAPTGVISQFQHMGTTLHWWILWVVLVDLIWATGKCNKQDTEGLTHLPVRCKEILLSGGVVGDDGAKRLAHLMGAYSAVVLLDMPRNDVSDTGMVALASSLGSEGRDRHLQQLLLPGNKVTRSGAISLGKALQTNAQRCAPHPHSLSANRRRERRDQRQHPILVVERRHEQLHEAHA